MAGPGDKKCEALRGHLAEHAPANTARAHALHHMKVAAGVVIEETAPQAALMGTAVHVAPLCGASALSSSLDVAGDTWTAGSSLATWTPSGQAEGGGGEGERCDVVPRGRGEGERYDVMPRGRGEGERCDVVPRGSGEGERCDVLPRVAWLYFGSHNLSGAAWGKTEEKATEDDPDEYVILHYELGILHIPPGGPTPTPLPWVSPARDYAFGDMPFSTHRYLGLLYGRGDWKVGNVSQSVSGA